MTVPPFDNLFASELRRTTRPPRILPPGECQSAEGWRCSLCAASVYTYVQELQAKQSALNTFWNTLHASAPLDPLLPSPLGRGYRTVTKRKAFRHRDSVRIGLIDPSERGSGRFDPLRCAIEPKSHAEIYAVVRHLSADASMHALADELTYVVVKGSYTEKFVLFNVRAIRPGVIQAANRLSKQISAKVRDVAGVFLYEGGSDESYYQGTRAGWSLRKIYGASSISVTILGKRFDYSPLSFSQVNQSMLPALVRTAGSMLQRSTRSTLYDLYCGYGLFALSFAEGYGRVVGIEREPASIEAAKRNAERLHVRGARFVRNDITAASLAKSLRDLRPTDAVILDPPRGGPGPDVVECISSLRPGRVLHIFCNIDLIPGEMRRWEAGGYRLVRAVPMDLFPGTPDVEMLLLFERAQG